MTGTVNLTEISLVKNSYEQDFVLELMGSSSFFTTRSFMNSLNLETEMWLLKENEEPIVASLVQRKSGSIIKFNEGYSKYQGLIFARSVKNWSCDRIHHVLLPSIEKLLINIEDSYPSGVTLSLDPSISDIRPFLWRTNSSMQNHSQWIVTPKYTAIIELSKFNSFQQYIKTIRKSTLQAAKNLENKGYKICDGSMDELINLHYSSLERQNTTPSKEFISTIRSIGNSAKKNSTGEVLLIYTPEGIPVSGLLLVYDKHTGYIITAGTKPKWRRTNVGAVLWLESIRNCFHRGLQRIDFLGANDRGRAGFKAGFSANLQLYFEVSFKSKEVRK